MSQKKAQFIVPKVHTATTPKPPPSRPTNCAPGLEYLASIDQLIVHKKTELLATPASLFEREIKYDIRNSLGQKVFFATENSDFVDRIMCSTIRPFEMKIFDSSRNEVIHLDRPIRFCGVQKMKVSSPPGNVIGSIQEELSGCIISKFVVKDANGNTVLRIERPHRTCRSWICCHDVNFSITNADGSADVGKIGKQLLGTAEEAFTDADNFSVTFPRDLDVKMKAVLLGALFMIDFSFFD